VLFLFFKSGTFLTWVAGRTFNRIPVIVPSKWNAIWHLASGEIYTAEIVSFDKWTSLSRFRGLGTVKHGNRLYEYTIEGEISPDRVVVISYKAENFPTESNFGVAHLKLSGNAQELTGNWIGPTEAGELVIGKVEMTRFANKNKDK
jgi:hypothetical protein